MAEFNDAFCASNVDREKRRRVLVTGGTGLYGKGLETVVSTDPTAQNEEVYFFCNSKDADLTNREQTAALFEKIHPTHVIHLAAKVGGLFANMRHKVEFFRTNAQINDNVLECCRIYKVEKLVSCLSTCIFPDSANFPIDETMVHNGPPHPSNEGYAYAKRMIDVLNRCYREEYGCNFTSVVPTNIYGMHDNFSIDCGHVIPGLIHKCYLAMKEGKDFVVWGSGAPLRQFIYSKDLARLTLWVLRSYDEVEPVILSVDPTDEVTIAEVARIVAKQMGFQGNIVFDTTKADGQYKKTANNAKLRSLCPGFEFTPIEDGLKETVAWFLENVDKIRK